MCGTLNGEAQTPGTTNRNGSVVKLLKNPKDLYSVWKEWEFGLNGMKAAKDYSYHERTVIMRRGQISLATVDARCFGML